MTKKFRITLTVEAKSAQDALEAIKEYDTPEILDIRVEQTSKLADLFNRPSAFVTGGYTSPATTYRTDF